MAKKSIEERLIASARQALAIKRGEIRPAQAYDLPLTAREASADTAPDYSKTEIARIRSSLGLSQALFADALNVSLGTVRSWEQGIRSPDGAASRLLQIAERDPNTVIMFVQRGRNRLSPSGIVQMPLVSSQREHSIGHRTAMTGRFTRKEGPVKTSRERTVAGKTVARKAAKSRSGRRK